MATGKELLFSYCKSLRLNNYFTLIIGHRKFSLVRRNLGSASRSELSHSSLLLLLPNTWRKKNRQAATDSKPSWAPFRNMVP